MRIISGQARGRKLLTLPGDHTRPTLDSTREALFNILRTCVLDAQVLDLFAGSGALALEALSRGAKSAVLCDSAPDACAVIRKNIEAVRVAEKAVLLQTDAKAACARLRGQRFDLLFLDPPYRMGLVDQALCWIAEHNLCAPGGTIVAETSMEEGVNLPVGFTLTQTRKYGKTLLFFIERIAE